MIYRLVVILFAAFSIFAVNARLALAEDYGATARGIFIMLPTSVFESTPEGLSEEEKQELLANGSSEFWEIAGETPDVMVFTTLPFRDKAIGLRLFRNNVDGSVDVAIGTLGEPVCTLELWRLDSNGRLVPVDTPEEPAIGEFFGREHKLSSRIRYSVLVCLGAGGLMATPIFWNDAGMLPSKIRNEINYLWTGDKFEKRVQPAPEK